MSKRYKDRVSGRFVSDADARQELKNPSSKMVLEHVEVPKQGTGRAAARRRAQSPQLGLDLPVPPKDEASTTGEPDRQGELHGLDYSEDESGGGGDESPADDTPDRQEELDGVEYMDDDELDELDFEEREAEPEPGGTPKQWRR